ncbi:MAG: homoserine dehydrogenase [Alphaproteobacteria bacterium]|nr:homoserine dehydrogenase [Alphaproteobacteria bacterium]
MSDKIRVGLAGLGTVGATVAARLLQGAVSGAKLAAVSARDANKDRGVDLGGIDFLGDPLALVTHADVDVVVELIGGENGTALNLVEAALKAGKPVVTANKAMLAAHAAALSDLSVGGDVPLAFEAAVAGGIPVIKTVREGLAGNDITRLCGILNGTCNYILSRMEAAGLSFADALKEAQELGFAEADPTLDVSGADAGQKLAILSALAYGVAPNMENISITGIEAITAADIAFADQFDSVIRLVGTAARSGAASDGGVYHSVEPVLVKKSQALAQVLNELNAVSIAAAPLGSMMLQGPGAGGGATASAVLADIADIAAGFGRPLFDKAVSDMTESASQGAPASEFYIRLALADQPGSMAKATQILAENGVSIEEVVQRSSESDDSYLPVVFITHQTEKPSLDAALAALEQQSEICNAVLALPVFAD